MRRRQPPAAHQLLKLLQTKHAKDVFVAECKNGPTQGAKGMVRMDAWVMPRSWAHPETTAYEIKVTRQDFIGDRKWVRYLDYCHRLYFVTPPGVCDRDEIPDGVGWLCASKNLTRLYTKKKANVRRDVVIPESLWRYVIMARARIEGDLWCLQNEPNAEYWREWLAQREEDRDLGHRVSSALSRMVAERVTKVDCENKRLEAVMRRYDEVRQILEEMGITSLSSWDTRRRVKEAATAELAGIIPRGLVAKLSNVRGCVDTLITALEKVQSQNPEQVKP